MSRNVIIFTMGPHKKKCIFCELIKNILFYNYSLGSEQWAPSCNYTHLLIFILSPETCWQISVVCCSRTSLWCRKRDVLLKLHLYTDRTGSFTGSAHLRSKWSVCGSQWEMSLTFLMYCCSSCQILGPFPTFFWTSDRPMTIHPFTITMTLPQHVMLMPKLGSKAFLLQSVLSMHSPATEW